MADNVIVRVPEQQFIRGEDGYSPEVTIEDIAHGHSVTITDRDHPTGQSFNVMDGDSAYEQAVAGGYTGTEAQFNEELASFKELSDEMKEVAPFYAEYGVTTKAEIEAAINNKRQIYLNRGGGLGGVVAPYTGTFLYADIWGEGTGYRFARTNGNWQYVYELKSEWTYSIYDLTAPAQRAEAAADQALIRMNSADASAQAAAGSAGDASTAATTATTKAGAASNSATAADGSAKDAEAYAIGKRGGTDVGSTDPAYHNNAKYYAQQASGSATAASGSATSAASSATAAGNAQTAAETAQSAAEDAQAAAEAVLASIPSDYTTLSGDVDNLKSAFEINSDLRVASWAPGIRNCNVIGDVIGDVTYASASYVHSILPCAESDIVTVNVRGANAARAWAYLDVEYKVLQCGESNTLYANAVLPNPPQNTAYVLLNNRTASQYLPEGYYGFVGSNLVKTRLSALESGVSNAISMLNGGMVHPRLKTNDDLNDYTNVGQYTIPSAEVAWTLKNLPAAYQGTGSLTVLSTHNENHVYQILLSNQSTAIWSRHIRIDSRIFDNWKTLVGESKTWESKDFLIHNPMEEYSVMLNVIAERLGITLENTTDYVSDNTQGERNISSENIYQLWDSLHNEYPQYVDAGEIIGYSLDPDGNNYAPVKAYYIHPRLSYVDYNGATQQIAYTQMPTIYITAGTHGGESTPTWVLFEIFRRALLTGTIYSDFLDGLTFRVVPCLDRWCYDNHERFLAAAYNSDGTVREEAIDPTTGEINEIYNANRQCICSDMSNPSYNTLTIREFATEAKALTDYLQNHNFSAVNGDCYIDLHNCSYSLGYLTTETPRFAHMYNTMVDSLSKDWHNNTTWANGDPVDYYESNTSDHTKARGKILAHPYVISSYAWFFDYAYSPFCSCLHESQQSDGSAGNRFAFAKAFDITYRWFRCLLNAVKESQN